MANSFNRQVEYNNNLTTTPSPEYLEAFLSLCDNLDVLFPQVNLTIPSISLNNDMIRLGRTAYHSGSAIIDVYPLTRRVKMHEAPSGTVPEIMSHQFRDSYYCFGKVVKKIFPEYSIEPNLELIQVQQ
jgi:hypothetical protein